MRKTNTNLSNYDDFRKYSVEEIGNMLGIGKTKTRELPKNFSCNIMQLHLLFIWYFKESSFHSKGANLNVE